MIVTLNSEVHMITILILSWQDIVMEEYQFYVYDDTELTLFLLENVSCSKFLGEGLQTSMTYNTTRV
jgi:hypothetical protein